MEYGKIAFIFFFLSAVILIQGCGSKVSSLLTEEWSENYALASYGTKSSNPRINDGDIATWGVVDPPKRVFNIILPEERWVKRVVVYSQNVVSYKLFCWDNGTEKWKAVSAVGSVEGRRSVYSDRYKMNIPRFDHRINVKTDKISIQVIKAEGDGIVTTRTPGKDDAILNHKIDFLGTGRSRRRIDLYEVYKKIPAAIREIEVYSHLEKPKSEQQAQ